MADGPPDYLGLNDDDDPRKRSPALVVGQPMQNHELVAAEALYRRGSKVTGGASLVLFTNATDGVEEWDAPEEAERWRRMMAWPVIPTVEDALAKHPGDHDR